MDLTPPIFVDITVPDAALLEARPSALPESGDGVFGAVWFRADTAAVSLDAQGAVQVWHPQGDFGLAAVPVAPNDGQLKASKVGALIFEAKVNAGLVIEKALVQPEAFSIAVRYTSEAGEARSLVTVNPPDADTYLFLAEKEARIVWQDQQDSATLTVPAPKGGGWVVAGYEAGRLSLATASPGGGLSAVERAVATDAALQQALAGVCDVFVGCRSHRKGILKTLGQSHVSDVLLWVDQDVTAQNSDAIAPVLRHCEAQRGQS